jgi:hypothetical protein
MKREVWQYTPTGQCYTVITKTLLRPENPVVSAVGPYEFDNRYAGLGDILNKKINEDEPDELVDWINQTYKNDKSNWAPLEAEVYPTDIPPHEPPVLDA